MSKIWKWLDGKKTGMGAILLIICGVPHLENWVSADMIDVIYYIGSILGAGGVVHKVTKRQKKE